MRSAARTQHAQTAAQAQLLAAGQMELCSTNTFTCDLQEQLTEPFSVAGKGFTSGTRGTRWAHFSDYSERPLSRRLTGCFRVTACVEGCLPGDAKPR